MKKTMDFLFTVIMMLGVVLIATLVPTEKDVAIYEDTLRLHILASSNDARDQELKYKIRDRLLEKYATALSSYDSADGAKEHVALLADDIERDVGMWTEEYGFDYGCEVTVGVEWYDTREYEDFTLPRGYYTSVRVMLGEAEGQNWWCVMYPPLCLDIATECAPSDDALCDYTKEEIMLIGEGKYTVKFKLLELTSEIFAYRRR